MAASTTSVLVRRLNESALFQSYRRAYCQMTGLPLELCAVGSAEKEAGASTLLANAIPIRVGDAVVAVLVTTRLRQHPPFRHDIIRVPARRPAPNRSAVSARHDRHMVEHSQYGSVLGLLRVFALHLSTHGDGLLLRGEGVESPAIQRARAMIAEGYRGPLTFRQVAGAVGLNTCCFCRRFHRSTGLTFTEYLARMRVDAAKRLLSQPHIRVSEAAYGAGFQSLSQFNRVFRRIAGVPPSEFRQKPRAHLQ